MWGKLIKTSNSINESGLKLHLQLDFIYEYFLLGLVLKDNANYPKVINKSSKTRRASIDGQAL